MGKTSPRACGERGCFAVERLFAGPDGGVVFKAAGLTGTPARSIADANARVDPAIAVPIGPPVGPITMLGVIPRRRGECAANDAPDDGAREKAAMVVMVVMVVILSKLHASARPDHLRRIVCP